MLIEIPDPEVIFSVILAFVVGLGGLYVFYKIRPYIKTSQMDDSSQSERLEYYERQLIDMKIRLDALELQGIETKTEDPNMELKQYLEQLTKKQETVTKPESKIEPIETKEQPQISENTPNIDSNDITEHVLHLITNKVMTSRDIQKALDRSREHTSRLMKKMYEDGLVERNTKTKPYTYSISEKGLEKISAVQQSPTVA
ncbi:helix-turn-helix transcriptional regulator [Nitrosopumilus sp. K4]|uniref:winged helix DNA-binding protein n=1 Tax=Nitrosopumilus sp. K4 TaxID=2795383 RepID=UPI001BAE4F27|nr:winged helix DNA-binding protein [Nitrosopumilus sp. K4]QUC65743.1 helix-turn-helix transcriptional regulator [Nitrosopumilus sp. K4]